jgi:hypothetical protein
MKILSRISLYLINIFFIVVIFLASIYVQPIIAPVSPTVTITSSSVSEGATVTSRYVVFSFTGTDYDNYMTGFRCSIYVGRPISPPEPSSQHCPGAQGIDQTDYPHTIRGTVTLHLSPNSAPYTFVVVGVNNLGIASPHPAYRQFTISTQPSTPSGSASGPTVQTSVTDIEGFVVSTQIPTWSDKLLVKFHANGNGLQRWCETSSQGPLPVNPSHYLSSDYIINSGRCHVIEPGANDFRATYETVGQLERDYWSCIVVWDNANRMSSPSCVTYRQSGIPSGHPPSPPLRPPFLRINFHQAFTSTDYDNLNQPINPPHTTPFRNILFGFEGGRTRTGPWHVGDRLLFSCLWDNMENWEYFVPCGDLRFDRVPAGYHLPDTVSPVGSSGYAYAHDVSRGCHILLVKARFINSLPNRPVEYPWCIDSTSSRISSIISEGSSIAGPQGNANTRSITDEDIRSALYISAYAGEDSNVNPRDAVTLESNLYFITPTNVHHNESQYNETGKIISTKGLSQVKDLKFLWRQTAGPPVDLNSVKLQGNDNSGKISIIKFLAPSVEKRTKLTFNLTLKDTKNRFNTTSDLVDVWVNATHKDNDNSSKPLDTFNVRAIADPTKISCDTDNIDETLKGNLKLVSDGNLYSPIYKFTWKQNSGPSVNIKSIHQSNTEFRISCGKLESGDTTVSFSLSVIDEHGKSSQYKTKVTLVGNVGQQISQREQQIQTQPQQDQGENNAPADSGNTEKGCPKGEGLDPDSGECVGLPEK